MSRASAEELLEIETSKITNVVEVDAPGTLPRIMALKGTALQIGPLLAVIAPSDAPVVGIDAFVAQFAVVESSDAAAENATPRPASCTHLVGRYAAWSWAAAMVFPCRCCTVSAPT